MEKYELYITPKYKTETKASLTVLLDDQNFIITKTATATGIVNNGGGSYTITIPKGIAAGTKYKTGIILEPKDGDVDPYAQYLKSNNRGEVSVVGGESEVEYDYTSKSVIKYTITIKVTNPSGVTETIEKKAYNSGATIQKPSTTSYTGYNFSWNDTGTWKADSTKTYIGTYTRIQYTITYLVDNKPWTAQTYYYGDKVSLPVYSKEGYTISFPNTIKDGNSVTGNLTVYCTEVANTHMLTVKCAENGYESTTSVKYGSDLAKILNVHAQSKTGYDFNWRTYPQTMPDSDLTIEGYFTKKKYTVKYLINNSVWTTQTYEYEDVLIYPEYSEEGYTISFPSSPKEGDKVTNNISITCTKTANKHTITINYDDGTSKVIQNVDYGTNLNNYLNIYKKTKEGYTFKWTNCPSYMPDNDITIGGQFSKNKYTVTFKIANPDGTYTESSSIVEYGGRIEYPSHLDLSGYEFTWLDNTELMPASNITIEGKYTKIIEKLNILYACKLNKDIEANNYDNMVLIENIQYGTEYTLNMYTPEMDYDFDNMSDEEYELWENENKFGFLILIPYGSNSSSTVVKNANGSDISNKFTFENELITIDGAKYRKVYRLTDDASEGNESVRHSITCRQ